MGDSPIKPQKSAKLDTRTERSDATQDRQISAQTENFQKLCLTEVPDEVLKKISLETKAEVKLVNEVSSQSDGYECSVALLNKIVQLLKPHYREHYRDNNIITFIALPNDPPRHHPRDYIVRPDIVALPGHIRKKLQDDKPSWHHLISVGEWKPGKKLSNADRGQEREYVGCAIQARPDNPSMLGVIMCTQGYILSYGSPCGYVDTEQIPFTDIGPLVRYVHSLHVRPPNINFADRKRTITLDSTVGLKEKPRWLITDPAYGMVNVKHHLIFVGNPFTRMTTVFSDGDGILKDSYPSVDHQREAGLFDALGEGPPGWVSRVQPIEDTEFDPLPQLDFGDPVFVHRQRQRLKLETSGLPFDQCKSLSEAIGVTYDILEASRWAIKKRRVLHRDISPGNVLIHPKPPSLPRDGVCFIDGVYTGQMSSPSFAVLLDLDNGVQLPKTHQSLQQIHGSTGSESRELKALTGTPMYIARGPASGEYNLRRKFVFEDMPQIQPEEASNLYTNAYPNDPFRKFQGNIGSLNDALWQECKQELPHTKYLIQRPWHDAESTIFVLLIFLLRCRPLSSAPEDQGQLAIMQGLYHLLRDTPIGTKNDHRNHMLQYDEATWRRTLHAGLEHVVPAIMSVCDALFVDYEFLVPTEGVDGEVVLHEIFQRCLFQSYYMLRKDILRDIEFDTSSFRPFLKDKDGLDPASSSKFSSSKRKSGADDTAERQTSEGSKRRRLEHPGGGAEGTSKRQDSALSHQHQQSSSALQRGETSAKGRNPNSIVAKMKLKQQRPSSQSSSRPLVLEDEDEDND